jgi:hypothetical protein
LTRPESFLVLDGTRVGKWHESKEAQESEQIIPMSRWCICLPRHIWLGIGAASTVLMRMVGNHNIEPLALASSFSFADAKSSLGIVFCSSSSQIQIRSRSAPTYTMAQHGVSEAVSITFEDSTTNLEPLSEQIRQIRQSPVSATVGSPFSLFRSRRPLSPCFSSTGW